MAALLGAAILTVAAQAPSSAQNPAGSLPPPPRTFPEPTNLKVLPKDFNGEQVHEVMEQWEAAIGGHCNTCHTADPNNIGPNGRPRLNFADDSKPEKATARLMFKMTEDLNTNYVAKIESSGMPVSCGTCHRGHLAPEPFVEKEQEKGPVRASQTPPMPH